MARDPRTYIAKTKGSRIGQYTVTVPVAPLHRKKSRQSGLETQLLFGQHFDVFEKDKNWVWGQSRSPMRGSKQKGYVGFVPLRDLKERSVGPDYIVTSLRAPLFLRADIKSRISMYLPLGGLVNTTVSDAKFLQLTSGEFIHMNHVRKQSEDPVVSDFVQIAQRHMGLPYVWGGVSTDGLDCSGLVQSSLRAVGKDAPRDADMQQAKLGVALPIKQSGLKRGDLVFWKGHVAILVSASKIIHANAFHMVVETEPLRDAARRIMENGGGPIIAIKRL